MLRIRLWQVIVVALICAASVIFAVPNLFTQRGLDESYPNWLPRQQVNLGLDLQGGSHLLLEVQIDKVLVERIDALVDDTRGALRGERIGYTGLKRRGQTVVFQLTNLENIDAADDLLSDLAREVQVEGDDAGAFVLSLTDSAIVSRAWPSPPSNARARTVFSSSFPVSTIRNGSNGCSARPRKCLFTWSIRR